MLTSLLQKADDFRVFQDGFLGKYTFPQMFVAALMGVYRLAEGIFKLHFGCLLESTFLLLPIVSFFATEPAFGEYYFFNSDENLNIIAIQVAIVLACGVIAVDALVFLFSNPLSSFGKIAIVVAAQLIFEILE